MTAASAAARASHHSGCARPIAPRRPPCARGLVEQAETGGAAARHARELAAGLRLERGKNVADRRQEAAAPAPADGSPGRAARRAARLRSQGGGPSSRGRLRASRRGRRTPPRSRAAGRVDQQQGQGGQAVAEVEPLADAAHARRAAGRQTGTSAPSCEPERRQIRGAHAEPPQPVEAAQRRRRIGRAAAQARGDRHPLLERDPYRWPRRPTWPASRRAARSTRLSGSPASAAGERPGDVQLEALIGLKRQPVAERGRTPPGCRARGSRRHAGR